MRTCVIMFMDDDFENVKCPDSYAVVGPAGELTVMQEYAVNELRPTYGGPTPGPVTRCKTIAVYAPGTWRGVTYEEE